VAKAPGWNAPDGEGRKPGERTGLDTRVGMSRGIKCSLSKCKDGAYCTDIKGSHILTDVNPNKCGEPVNRLRGALPLQGGEEVIRGHTPESPGCKRCGLGVGRA
jgi:hypothetical protein